MQEHRVWGAREPTLGGLGSVVTSRLIGGQPAVVDTRRAVKGWRWSVVSWRGRRGGSTPRGRAARGAPDVPGPRAAAVGGGLVEICCQSLLLSSSSTEASRWTPSSLHGPQIILAAASGPHMAEQTDTERAGGARAATTADKETTLKVSRPPNATGAALIQRRGTGPDANVIKADWPGSTCRDWPYLRGGLERRGGGVFDQVTAPAERGAAWAREVSFEAARGSGGARGGEPRGAPLRTDDL
ncbi:unnamed protein product [Arctogadus glacialis]